MNRFRAFAIHLGISFAIFALVLGLLILLWYPWPLFDLEGGWQGLRLVALVDIVLGPMLTLILFKAGKPGLKFDMSVVVLLQIGALLYGMWNLYDARPVLLVHAGDHFVSLSRGLVNEWDSDGTVLREWEGMMPQHIRVDVPDDPVAYADLVRATAWQPGGLHSLTERYQPLHKAWQKALQDAVRIEPYAALTDDWQQRLQAFTSKLGRPVRELAFFPYIGRRERVFLAFDRETLKIVGVLDIPYDPAKTHPEVPRIERVGLGHSSKQKQWYPQAS